MKLRRNINDKIMIDILVILCFLVLVYFSNRAMNMADEYSRNNSKYTNFYNSKCCGDSICNLYDLDDLDGKKVRIKHMFLNRRRVIEGFLSVYYPHLYIYKNKDDERKDFICMIHVEDKYVISIEEIK